MFLRGWGPRNSPVERMTMAKLIVSFESEQEAQEAINQLLLAEIGEVRARVLDSSEWLGDEQTTTTAPEIVPDMGSVEVRPSEPPEILGAEPSTQEEEGSTQIPLTGARPKGVQVMIEVDDEQEARAREYLTQRPGNSAD
jgi:hypothetical protein